MSPDAVTRDRERWALFLDVDGELLGIAENPDRVHVPEKIKQLLLTLTVQFDGAVALLSGRSLDEVDRLLSPLKFCVAGMHGGEYREACGCVTRAPLHEEQLLEVRDRLQALVCRYEHLSLECKRDGLTVHFRHAPQLREEVQHAPFASRIPVLVGDDAMDESAFEFVNDRGGISIKAGARECTAAHYRLPVAHDVVTWLESIATRRAGCS